MRVRSLFLFAIACAAPALAQTRRAMTVDDVLDLVQVSAPRISPDGRRVLYTKSELAPWKDNKRTSTIWIVDADGTHPRQFLGSDKDRNPSWSPDGSRIAFLSSRDAAASRDDSGGDAASQIWIISTAGGEATKLTEHKGAIRSFREPHHQRIRDTEEIAWLMKYARGIDWTAPPRRDETATSKKTSE